MEQQQPARHDSERPDERRIEGYYALELTGRDQSLWHRWRTRFVARLKNKMRGFFGRRGPRGKTIQTEADEAVDSAVSSFQALLAKAAIENDKNKVEIEKLRAEIERTKAESRFTDAKTRESEAHTEVLRAQARKLELEVQVQQLQTSTTIIEAMIAKGQLHIRETTDGVYIVANEALRLESKPTQSPMDVNRAAPDDSHSKSE